MSYLTNRAKLLFLIPKMARVFYMNILLRVAKYQNKSCTTKESSYQSNRKESCRALFYFQMNVVVLQFSLRQQGSLHRTKLRALWDASLGEDTTQEAVDVEDQRQTGPGLGHHGPVGDGVQGAVLRTHRGVGIITLVTP